MRQLPRAAAVPRFAAYVEARSMARVLALALAVFALQAAQLLGNHPGGDVAALSGESRTAMSLVEEGGSTSRHQRRRENGSLQKTGQRIANDAALRAPTWTEQMK